MASIFAILFILSLGFLVQGLVSPQSLARHRTKPFTRVQTSVAFGLVAVLCLILSGATYRQPITHKVNLNVVNTAQKKSNTTTKQITETQTINFTTTDQNDNTLPKGQTKTIQAGQNGLATLIYKVTYNNGQQTSKVLISKTTTTQPVNQIVAIGTYVAPVAATTNTSATTSDDNDSTQQTATCSPQTDSGGCYEPGEYCRDSDHGSSGVAGDGKSIVCEDNDGWRWEPTD